jgi:hypothetical protein
VERFGFVKFLLVSVAVLLFMYYPVILLRHLWYLIFGGPAPSFVIGLFLFMSVSACLPSLLYRYVYEGKPSGKRPSLYAEFKGKMEQGAFFGFASALVLIWYGLGHEWGQGWVVTYMILEIVIGGLADRRRKRVWNTKLASAQREWPDGSPDQVNLVARMWFEEEMREESPVDPQVLNQAAELLDGMERQFFLDYALEHPQIIAEVLGRVSFTQGKESIRLDLAASLCSTVQSRMLGGYLKDVYPLLLIAQEFEKENPLTWCLIAEYKLAVCDGVAAKWAQKLIRWQPHQELPYRTWKTYSSQEGELTLNQMKARMSSIILGCEGNPQWNDSSTWLMPEELK